MLAICTVGLYFPVHHHPFSINDDEQYVANNPHLQGDFGWQTVRWAFTTNDLANWHPLTWLSHAADVQMFHLDPAGHHDINLLLQVINVLLLFWVLYRATGLMWRSFTVAALLAFHPINVETVAWIAERKNLLSMLFFLLALAAYRSYANNPRIARYLAVAFLYALGLMAKPQIITFPMVLLLWDYWPLGRMFAKAPNSATKNETMPRGFWYLLLEKVPLLLLSLGSAILTLRAQRLAGALRYFPLSFRLENAIVAYVRYIGKALWPFPLVPFYPHTPLSAWQIGASLFLLLGITAWVVYWRRQRYLAVGWFWYLGTLVPMIGIVQVGEQAMADRYGYLSFIGLFLMVCWGVADEMEKQRLPRRWLAAASVIVLCALAVLTYRQLNYWSSNVALWEHTLEATHGSFEAEENLGVALLEAGRPEEAMTHFQQVIAIRPGSAAMGREQIGYAAVAQLYLGTYQQQHGRLEGALEHYEAVLRLARDFGSENVYTNTPPVLLKIKETALTNMGYVYYGLGEFGQSEESFREALWLEPHDARAWMGLGLAQQASGNLAGAVQAYSKTVNMKPSDTNLLLLAQALERSGKSEEAQSVKQRAALLSPNLAEAQRAVDRMLAHSH